MCSGHQHDHEPTFDAVVRNWRETDAPFLIKCWMVLKNTLKKLFTLKSCCGNYGEPGC